MNFQASHVNTVPSYIQKLKENESHELPYAAHDQAGIIPEAIFPWEPLNVFFLPLSGFPNSIQMKSPTVFYLKLS